MYRSVHLLSGFMAQTHPAPTQRPTDHDFVVSADGHLLEPTDLFRTRLPEHLRERAVWEEDFELDEPWVEGGARVFRRLHTAGYEGWTISRYRQTGGRTPEGDPEMILEDMELDGVDAQVLHPNLSLFGLYSDDHELSMAHARVYNDYVIERFSPYFDRIAPTAPIPITDIDDAVAEIQRVAAAGFRAVLLPATPPRNYYTAISTRCGRRSATPGCSRSSTPRPAASASTTPRPPRSRSCWRTPPRSTSP